MTNLIELAERVEQASGADRALDLHIWAALNGVSQDHVDAIMVCVRLQLNVECCPTYTASLDAAMSLVPEGWHFPQFWQDRYTQRSAVILARNGDNSGFCVGCEDAATPALALCAAALRARASIEGNPTA